MVRTGSVRRFNSFARLFGFVPSFSRLASAGLLLTLVAAAALMQGQDPVKRGRKYKAPPATAKVEVTVLRDTTGKPIENASVIFHPLEGGRDHGNMELKTNDEGKASLDLLEIGSSVRLQIIAHGFQTYGEDYKVDKDTMAIEIKLKRPGAQYSIYNKSEGNEPNKNEPKKDDADKPKDGAAPQPAAPQATEPQKDAPTAAPDAPKQESGSDVAKPPQVLP